jgi:hypothetical protein
MQDYNLGTLTIVSHEVDRLTQALGIPDDRFDDLVQLAHTAWEYEETISQSIEYLARNSNGSELALALVFFGRIWENQKNDDEDLDEEL